MNQIQKPVYKNKSTNIYANKQTAKRKKQIFGWICLVTLFKCLNHFECLFTCLCVL